jgi:ABC-type sugar transport system substrate-binding protein
MKIKHTAGLLTAGALIVGITGCGSVGDSNAGGSDGGSGDGSLKVGVSFDKMDDAFRVGEKKYLDQYAEEMGIELVYQDARSDSQQQSSQIQSFISQGVDGIVEIPWDTQAVAADISAAAAANIPLVVMDQQPADTDDVFFYVGGDPTSDGRMVGEWLVEAAAGEPLKVLELQGSLNNINGVERSAGFEEAVAKAPNIEIVAKAPTDWNADKALAATQNAFQSDPDIGAVYAPWTGALPAVYSVLNDLGKKAPVGEEGHIFTMSINGDEIGCKYVTSGENDIDIATPVADMAKEALQAIVDASEGTDPAENVVLLPGLAYTPGDIEQNRDAVWGCS